MKYIFFDADVWLNILRDENKNEVLKHLNELVDKKVFSFFIPTQLKDEINRNYERIIKSRKEKYKNYLKESNLLKNFLPEEFHRKIEEIELAVNRELPKIDNQTDKIIEIFWKLLNHSNNVFYNIDDNIKLKAAARAITKKAPFHRNKNSIGDALLIESVFDFVDKNNKPDFTFITLNTSDFCNPENNKLVHNDFYDKIVELKINFSIEPSNEIENLLQIKLPEEQKKALDTKLKFEPVFYTIKNCSDCGGQLIEEGYKNLFGYAGWLKRCHNCGKLFSEVDSNY